MWGMHQVPVCPVCGAVTRLYAPGTLEPETFFTRSGDYKIAAGGSGDRLPIFRCTLCGHGFSPIVGDPGMITRWYTHGECDGLFLSEESARRRTARNVLQRIAALHPDKGTLLDVGAGPGFFLSEANAREWTVIGLEPLPWAVKHAQQVLHLSGIREGDSTLLAELPPLSVDVVTAFDVLEHVVHPKTLLEATRRVLQPHGLLVLTTPRFDSVVARLMGKRWHCIVPAHLHYFSRPSLTRLLTDTGYELIREHHHTRFLSAQYLWRRVLDDLGIQQLPEQETNPQWMLPVNLGDEFELYARKR